jgi:hypothetical protein
VGLLADALQYRGLLDLATRALINRFTGAVLK